MANIFLKLTDIPGESTDTKHPGWIELESFSWGETQGSASGGTGKVQMQDFHFEMKMSKASPVLFKQCATGEHIAEAILAGERGGESRTDFFFKWTLSDVLVTSYQTGGSAADAVPTEQISMNFAKIEVQYMEQKPDGSPGDVVRAGWDVKAGKSF